MDTSGSQPGHKFFKIPFHPLESDYLLFFYGYHWSGYIGWREIDKEKVYLEGFHFPEEITTLFQFLVDEVFEAHLL